MLFSFHVESNLYEEQYSVFLLLMLTSPPQVKYLCLKALLCLDNAGVSSESSFPLVHPRAYILTPAGTKDNFSPDSFPSLENNLSFPLRSKNTCHNFSIPHLDEI